MDFGYRNTLSVSNAYLKQSISETNQAKRTTVLKLIASFSGLKMLTHLSILKNNKFIKNR